MYIAAARGQGCAACTRTANMCCPCLWQQPYESVYALIYAAGYAGPYPIEKVCIGYGGSTSLTSFPPVGAAANLPKEAGSSYQHLAFVELDR